jgi:hypothetical protein
MAEQTKRQQLESHLAARARQDPDFRERLLQDPKGTIEAEIRMKFPSALQIEVHEEKMNQLHVVLPIDLLTGKDLMGGLAAGTVDDAPFWKRVLHIR